MTTMVGNEKASQEKARDRDARRDGLHTQRGIYGRDKMKDGFGTSDELYRCACRERDELREALRPFAVAYKKLPEYVRPIADMGVTIMVNLQMGDLRCAYEILDRQHLGDGFAARQL